MKDKLSFVITVSPEGKFQATTHETERGAIVEVTPTPELHKVVRLLKHLNWVLKRLEELGVQFTEPTSRKI